MTTAFNRQITLAARPTGEPKLTDFKLVEAPIPEPGEDQFLVKNLYLSVDPYMRGRMNDRKSYAEPVQIGEVMGGGAVGRIVKSSNPKYHVGQIVMGYFGWQEYAVSNGVGVELVNPELSPISTSLGVLGMPGMTAYFGLLEICKPRAGETVVVSGASGAVGELVGQIAKIKHCRVVGIAGSDDKVEHVVKDLGFDAAFNYKTTTDYEAKLRELCPRGIDIYFDNVGGTITDAVMTLINPRARISVCGQISQYNAAEPEMGPRLLGLLIERQARMEGFLVFQFAEKMRVAQKKMADWIRTGKLKYRESVVRGIENTPTAFIGMLRGENIGKQLVQLADV
ncbi:MAG: NADP-dependent oxidoreductase [Candidatus Binatus sp.]|uniref:NADP-dependent oxidoreductase n=1 Tax=Candidatus Binatus sp. TaxID=2811406 RepID=UPI002722E121|nr:NADP-dependent oxidoreductase [Candidatus Binatus sp.]MDO8433813.1 NADP-dependent oxidoreductase [Candidatus Binatus sp.]